MARFQLTKPEEVKVVSNKSNQPIRLIEGPPGWSPFVVQGSLWQGNLRISIRQHFHPKDRPDLLLPSKTGIDVVPEAAEAIARGILEIIEEMKQRTDPVIGAALDLGAEVTK